MSSFFLHMQSAVLANWSELKIGFGLPSIGLMGRIDPRQNPKSDRVVTSNEPPH